MQTSYDSYEVGFCGEQKDENGDLVVSSFDTVSEILDQRIREICYKSGGDEPPRLYMTGKGNFREQIAVTKPYKGTRKGVKPWHYDNITHYIKAHYDTVETQGWEADDQMVMDQMAAEPETTVICSRDKDLRMAPGWHYGWECGLQPEFGPMLVDEIGWIDLIYKNDKPKEIKGVGLKFFYSQLITGDKVDNIPGLPGGGPVLAFETLDQLTTEKEMCRAVSDLYRQRLQEDGPIVMVEQAQLLWMVRELDEEGKPVMWLIPYD